jgi:predicted enzyme related to lactoylglutathione lyase
MDHGNFVWYEYTAADPGSAAGFYGSVMGWTAEAAEVAGIRFTMFRADGTPVAAMYPLQDLDPGTPKGWTGYVAVRDLDEAATRMEEAGGAAVRRLTVGDMRLGVFKDPQGARIAMMENCEPRNLAYGTKGTMGWHELLATDWESVFGTYSALFGWTKGIAMEGCPTGVYQIIQSEGRDIGAMMTKVPDVPEPTWLFYVFTDSITAAAERVHAAGGQVIFGPQEVPGGMWIINALDPQGSSIALVGPLG